MNNRLATLVWDRLEGSWELLATAAGNPVAIINASKMLSRELLDDQVHPDWMIKERVEALAAHDPAILASLASRWPKPGEASSSLVNVAWQAGLRHVLPILNLRLDDFAVAGFSDEVSILWHADTTTPITWSQAFQQVDARPVFDYSLVRRLSRRPLVGPLPSIAEIHDSPVGMLRLLRGHSHQLSRSVQEYLIECAYRCLSADLKRVAESCHTSKLDPDTGQWIVTKANKYTPLGQRHLEGDAIAALPIVERCREFNPGMTADLSNQLADQILRSIDPRLVAPLVYLLFTSWTLP